MARLIDAVYGHKKNWNELTRLIASGRLAHGLGFVGDNGIGKKMQAWALAQALICEQDTAPCGECPLCRRIATQASESVLFIEPEKGTVKLESATRILQFLNLRRLGRARVVIMDQAQTMNAQTANALLKVIEEPPPQTYFILLTPEIGQLLPTLRSRLQIFRFAPLSETELKQACAGSETDVSPWMLRSARGSRERLDAFGDEGGEGLRLMTLEFLASSLNGRREGLETLLDENKERTAVLRVLHFLQQLLRDWSVLGEVEILHSDLRERLQKLPERSLKTRLELWRRAFAMELDFNAHLDRTLLFENFFNTAQEAQ